MNKQNTKYIVSYGGGVNLTAMIVWLIKNKKPIDYIIFSDAGNEVLVKDVEQYHFEAIQINEK